MFWKKALVFLLVVTLSFAVMAPTLGAAPLQDSKEVDVDSIAFFGEAARLLRNPEEEGSYVSTIMLTTGSDTMVVDGENIKVQSPQTEKGRELLPVADIAEALGAEVEVDAATGEITIMEGDEVAVLNTPLPLKDSQLYDIQEVAEALTLDYTVEGENIIMTRPFQSKMLLVLLKPGKKLSGDYGAADVISDGQGRYVLKYDSISQTKEGYDEIKALSDCQNIMPNMIVFSVGATKAEEIKAFALPGTNWGAERVHVDMMKRYLEENGKTNSNIVVATMDTGALATHPLLAGRLLPGHNFSTNQPNNPGYTVDGNGHGTSIAGNIVTCTPNNVKIMPVKVLGDAGTGYLTDLVSAIKWVVDENAGVKIMNMSLSITNVTDNQTWDWQLREACEYAVGKGATIVTAAGNAETGKAPIDTKYVSPARLDCVITVAATDSSDNIAYFSNFGDSVNISAPGVSILTGGLDDKYYNVSGTSIATTFITAAAAMFSLIKPSLAFAGIREAVEEIAFDLGAPGWDRIYGWGIIDFELFYVSGMLTVGSGVVEPDNTVAFPVIASDSPMLKSLQFLISYPTETMELVNVTLPNTSELNLEVTSINDQDLISLTAEGGALIEPNGVLLYLNFEIYEYTWMDDFLISLQDIEAIGKYDNPIQFSTEDGFVNVIRYGDADGDGGVTLGDAILIAQYVNGWPVEINIQAADVDNDGKVTLADAILIAQYVGGWFDKFPVEGNTMPLSNTETAGTYDAEAPAVGSVTEDLMLAAVLELAGDVIPVTSIKIDAPAQVTVLRASTYAFTVILNPGATSDGVVWSVAPSGFASVNPTTGEVFTQNKIGTVALTATDTASGLSSSIILRIV